MPTIDASLFAKYKGSMRTFVETGTLTGDGVQNAIDAGYTRILSIEIDDMLWSRAKERFMGDCRVQIMRGNSAALVPVIVLGLDEPCLWWLDAHHSGGSTGGKGLKPVYDEIRAIASENRHGHVVLIDDIRDFGADKCKALLPGYEFKLETGHPLYPNNVLACFPARKEVK